MTNNKFRVTAKFSVNDNELTATQSYKIPYDLSEENAQEYEFKMEAKMENKGFEFDYSYTMYVEYNGQTFGTVMDLFEYLKDNM